MSILDRYENDIQKNCNPDPIVDDIIHIGNPIYKLTVKAYSTVNGGYIYWYISSKGIEPSYNHPFKYYDKDYNKEIFHEAYNVVANNSLVRLTFQYLIMSDTELSKLAGTMSSMEYRSKLIEFIGILWS